MGLFVSCPQIARADVRVDLGCDQTFVSQQFLDAANVSPSIEKMCRETVTQGVGGGPLVEPRFPQVFFEHTGHTAGRDAGPEAVYKYRRVTPLGFPRRESADFHPFGQRASCIRPDRGQPLTTTFSADTRDARTKIEVSVT